MMEPSTADSPSTRTTRAKRLSDEEQARVDQLLTDGAVGVIKRIGNIELRLADLLRLRPERRLHDELINAYMDVLTSPAAPGQDEPPLRALAFNSFFYGALRQGGHAAVARWTRGIDLFDGRYAYVLVPIHYCGADGTDDHWCLLAINLAWRRIDFYDSLYDRVHAIDLDLVRRYLCAEFNSHHDGDMLPCQWKLNETRTTAPQQQNGYDCGVFVCQIARALLHHQPLRSVKQSDMVYYRARMLLDLVDF
jgi:sentrin-specific protease 1